jgi:hypothetical protein
MAHSFGDLGGGRIARAPDAGEAYSSSHRSDGEGGCAALGAAAARGAAARAPDDEEAVEVATGPPWELAEGLRSSAEARWGKGVGARGGREDWRRPRARSTAASTRVTRG